MKIFLDFDDCLFDTVRVRGAFWRDLRSIYEHGGWSIEMIEETAEEFSDASFDGKPQTYAIEKHLALLHARQPSVRYEAVLEECHVFMTDVECYLFPDVIPFLQQFPRSDQFIITFGDPGFQKAKIFGAHIDSYVQDILVSEGQPKLALIRQYAEEQNFPPSEPIIFVDDKEKYFEPMKVGERKIVTVLMDRKGALEGKGADYHVKDCAELALILKSLEVE